MSLSIYKNKTWFILIFYFLKINIWSKFMKIDDSLSFFIIFYNFLNHFQFFGNIKIMEKE